MGRSLRSISNKVRQRQRAPQECDEDIPVVAHYVECPVCNGQMKLRRHVQQGLFWACDTYMICGTSHGAAPDGAPLGKPATPETKVWRIKAHEAFDPLWKSGEFSRSGAYEWLCEVMGKTEEEGHIALFTIEECQMLIEHVGNRSR